MPRGLRIWFPGAWDHIIARGNNAEAIFFSPRDYLKYLSLLREGQVRYDFRLHAYALMANHAHLLIETGQQPIAKTMQWVQTTYTCYVNRKHGRVGHLFQGRYRSLLVERDSYLLRAEPVYSPEPGSSEARSNPAKYRWSGYHAYTNSNHAGQELVTTHFILGLFDPRKEHQASLYREFIEGGVRPQAGQATPSPIGV